jgi:hypothetical protein
VEVNNSLQIAEPTSNGWLTLIVWFLRSSAIWLERLSRIFSHPTNGTSVQIFEQEGIVILV